MDGYGDVPKKKSPCSSINTLIEAHEMASCSGSDHHYRPSNLDSTKLNPNIYPS